jgi:hypothetical protein
MMESPPNRSANTLHPKSWEVALIFCLCLIIYANSFGVGWISDDAHFIKSNPAVRSLSNAGSFFLNPRATTASTSGYEGIYRPLRTLSFAVDYAIWGENPVGFHLTNFVLHFVSSVLVLLVCLSLGVDASRSGVVSEAHTEVIPAKAGIQTRLPQVWILAPRNHSFGVQRKAALVASMLFAVHPAHVEAVTWIASRADGMATALLLVSFLLFVRGRDAKESHALWLGGSLAFFVLALLSKETAIVLPALLIAYDVFPGRARGYILRWRLIEYFLFIVVAIVYFIARARLLQTVSQGGYWGGSLAATVLTMARCFLVYLRIVFLPRASSCLEYMVPPARFPLTLNTFWPLMVVAGFVIATITVWKFSPRAGFGLTWFLVALAPVSNVLPMSMLMAERFLYLPMVGICIATLPVMEAALGKMSRPVNRVASASACALLFLLGVASVVKNSAWREPVVLWNQTLQDYPDSYRARMGLAGAYLRTRRKPRSNKTLWRRTKAFPKCTGNARHRERLSAGGRHGFRNCGIQGCARTGPEFVVDTGEFGNCLHDAG